MTIRPPLTLDELPHYIIYRKYGDKNRTVHVWNGSKKESRTELKSKVWKRRSILFNGDFLGLVWRLQKMPRILNKTFKIKQYQ